MYRFGSSRLGRWRWTARYILSFLSRRLRAPRQSWIGLRVSGIGYTRFFPRPYLFSFRANDRRETVFVNIHIVSKPSCNMRPSDTRIATDDRRPSGWRLAAIAFSPSLVPAIASDIERGSKYRSNRSSLRPRIVLYLSLSLDRENGSFLGATVRTRLLTSRSTKTDSQPDCHHSLGLACARCVRVVRPFRRMDTRRRNDGVVSGAVRASINP